MKYCCQKQKTYDKVICIDFLCVSKMEVSLQVVFTFRTIWVIHTCDDILEHSAKTRKVCTIRCFQY